MPRTIAIVSGKGGAGKTTLALNLAVAASQAGDTVLVLDTDPQASASAWADQREAGAPVVEFCPGHRIVRSLDQADRAGTTLAIVDTAAGAGSEALTAAGASDLVLIPCRPSLLDVAALTAAADTALLAGVPSVVVLNAVPPHPRMADEARAALAAAGRTVLPVALGQRAVHVHAVAAGLGAVEMAPASRAAHEVRGVLAAIAAWPAPAIQLAASR